MSAFDDRVPGDVLAASITGKSAGAVAAWASGLNFSVVDAGTATGDLVGSDALDCAAVAGLLERGRAIGAEVGRSHCLLALGEVGVGNTTAA